MYARNTFVKGEQSMIKIYQMTNIYFLRFILVF